METKYFVARAFRYKESGNWEYKMVGMYDTISAAKQAYYSNMGSIINVTNDFAMVIRYDSYGNKIISDFDSTYVAPEPPEPNEGE
mgnify:CR=1 FL=1